ncbi:MAG TPA: ABC transporter permease [Thermotogota bacterium]|nr:ABC transporter permease [Thermotogota bacterium]
MKSKDRFTVYRIGISIGIALLIGYIIIYISSIPSGDMSFWAKMKEAFDSANNAYKYFLTGALIKWRSSGAAFNEGGAIQWINEASPIIITGLAISMVFTAKQFNIGAEGQMFLGAAIATAVAIYFPGIPVVSSVIVILVAMLAGAGYAAIPGVMKSKLNASELVTSLMLNYVAVFMGLFLIKTFLRDTSAGSLVSLPFTEEAMFPLLNERYKLHIGIFFAIGMTGLIWFIMKKTTWGYKVKLIGDNKNFAEYSGINSKKMILQVQVAAGAVAGSAGIIELLGYHGRFLWLYSPGYGWDGVIIATLARNNPLFVPLAAFFLSYIRVGAKIMGRYTDIAPEIVSILQAVIILLVTAEAFLSKWKQRSINKEATEADNARLKEAGDVI